MTTPRYYDSPVNTLAREIAKTFGGETRPSGATNKECFECMARVKVPACGQTPAYMLDLVIRGYGAKKDTLTVRLVSAHICNAVSKRFVWPKASFNSKRPLQSLLADIGRRVVNAPRTLSLLKEWEAECDAVAERASEILQHAEALQSRFRDMLYISPNYPPTTYEARLFGTGVDIRVSNSGVRFDRIGPLDHDKAARILTVVFDDHKSAE